MNLIHCGDGKMAPASMLCRHLVNGESDRWIQLPQPDGGEVFDYLCPKCLHRASMHNLGVEDLVTYCFHCAREMIEARGITPVSLDEEARP
jgi:hypothetical protein